MPASVSPSVSERWLLDRYRTSNDLAAREELIRRMTPLVRHVASSYNVRGLEDDLHQVAALGLTNAIERFDPSFGVSLRTYAIPTMTGEVRRYLRDHSWSVRPPRQLQERVLAVTKATEALVSRTGRAPSAPQIAAELSFSLEEVLEALQAGTAYSAASLDAPVGTGEDGDRTVGDAIGSEDERLSLAEDLADLSRLDVPLTAQERVILALRFVRDLTQTEIAQEVGVSQMQVSRILRRTIGRLSAATTQDPRRDRELAHGTAG
jgi:RNA polymerase sigma-B factor